MLKWIKKKKKWDTCVTYPCVIGYKRPFIVRMMLHTWIIIAFNVNFQNIYDVTSINVNVMYTFSLMLTEPNIIFYISMIWYSTVFLCYGMLFLWYAIRYLTMIWYDMLSHGMVRCAMLWDLSKRSFFLFGIYTLIYRFNFSIKAQL